MDKIISGKNIGLTDEGFLKDFAQWDKDIADALAAENQIVLTPRHWEVLTYIQNEFKNAISSIHPWGGHHLMEDDPLWVNQKLASFFENTSKKATF